MSKSMKQKKAIMDARNKELNKVQKLDPKFSCEGEVGTFIGLYLQSEVFAKKLQRYYRADIKKDAEDKLNIQALNAAIKHFNLSFNSDDIPLLFKGGAGKKGEKSARQLRNGYLHSLSSNDKNEIQLKSITLNSKLNAFLKLRLDITT